MIGKINGIIGSGDCAIFIITINKGTYIILYTSRNVRTFKGNIGLINKHTNVVLAEWLKNNNIPYDEIYFNKPWGFGDLNYIDDKFLSIEEFKSD